VKARGMGVSNTEKYGSMGVNLGSKKYITGVVESGEVIILREIMAVSLAFLLALLPL
jgi:hypothetical protein